MPGPFPLFGMQTGAVMGDKGKGQRSALSANGSFFAFILGYGLDIALVSLAGWPGASSMLTAGMTDSGIFSPFMLAKNIVFCLSFFIALAAAMCGPRNGWRVFRHPAAFCAFSVLYVAGALLALLEIQWEGIPLRLAYGMEGLSGALVGAGLAGNFILWVLSFCSQESPHDARGVVMGTLVGGVLFFLLAWLPSWLVCLISIVFIAPGTSALLVVCNFAANPPIAPEEQEGEACLFDGALRFPTNHDGNLANLKSGILALLAPCITIGALGAVMQLVRIGVNETSPSSEALVGNLNSLGLIASAIFTIILFERNNYHLNMDVFYRVCAPAVAIVVVLLPLLGPGYGFVALFAFYMLFSTASMMGILACIQVARHYQVPIVAIYSLMFGIIYAMRYVPVLVVGLFWDAGNAMNGPEEILVVVLACVCLMFAAYVFSDRYQRRQEDARVYSWESDAGTVEEVATNLAGGYARVVETVAMEHGLTEREKEVLLMLCRGRTVPIISHELGVSPNTARFHCKNLYAKLGVHSRQDLLDHMEQVLSDNR